MEDFTSKIFKNGDSKEHPDGDFDFLNVADKAFDFLRGKPPWGQAYNMLWHGDAPNNQQISSDPVTVG